MCWFPGPGAKLCSVGCGDAFGSHWHQVPHREAGHIEGLYPGSLSLAIWSQSVRLPWYHLETPAVSKHAVALFISFFFVIHFWSHMKNAFWKVGWQKILKQKSMSDLSGLWREPFVCVWNVNGATFVKYVHWVSQKGSFTRLLLSSENYSSKCLQAKH